LYFVRPPAPLWFLVGAGEVTATSAAVCVSVTYQISVSVGPVDSVDLELSALVYGLSVEHTDEEPGYAFSVQVGIDLNDEAYDTVDVRASITPVFLLEQSGGISKDVTLSAQASASITASVFVDTAPSVTYQVSASLSAVVSVEGQLFICVSTNYQISASCGALLNVQVGQLEPAFAASYAASISITPIVVVVNAGGLVWSKSKQRYIAIRVGDLTQ
jgi:hypothetical protein